MAGSHRTRRTSTALLGVAAAALLCIPGPAHASGSATAGAATTEVAAPARPHARLAIAEGLGVIGHPIHISTKGTSAAAGLRSLVISFGDGKRVTRRDATVRLSHRYGEAGTFTVRLTVVDDLGRRDRIAQKILITHAYGALPPTQDIPGADLPQAATLPGSVNLRQWTMPVQDQSPAGTKPTIGSCVSWAIGYAMMGWYYRHHYGQTVEFAPMYIYSQHHGPITDGQVTGMHPAEALETLKTQGIDTRAHYGGGWAYDYNTRPQAGDAKMQNAANYRISGYHSLFANKNTDGASPAQRYQIKAALSAVTPVAISVRLRTDFDDYERGVYRARGVQTGLHEMLAVGYNAKGLMVQNSWGTDWGRKGYVLLGWRAVRKDLYQADVVDGLVTATAATQDKVAPTVTAPTHKVQAGTTMNDNGIPVTLNWAGTDDSGSVAGYQLYAKTNGSEWVQQTLSSPTATSVVFALKPGSSYQFAVTAVDAAGNVSQLSVGTPFTVASYGDDSAYVGYYGTWERIGWPSADGGTLTTSSTPGSFATFSFTGSNVAWVSSAAPNRGQANVFVDDVYATTIDLYSATVVPKYVALHGNWGANETHKLTIEVVGTAGRPAVDIDSFVLLY